MRATKTSAWWRAVRKRLQACDFVVDADLRTIDRGKLTEPGDRISRFFQYLGIAESRTCNSIFAIVEYINVTGVSEGIAIEGRGAGHVAFRVAVGREKPQDFRLNSRQRHGRLARFVLRGGARAGHHGYAALELRPGHLREWGFQTSACTKEHVHGTPRRPACRGSHNQIGQLRHS